jgi:hypothetical protein
MFDLSELDGGVTSRAAFSCQKPVASPAPEIKFVRWSLVYG